MATNKSTFTFIVKDGEDFEFEIEAFFLNSKTQNIEPLSPSPRTTPRANKKPFGPVEKVTMVDEKIIKIENNENDELYLEVDRMSPFLDKDDSRLKSNLIALKNEATEVLVKALNKLIQKFHSNEFKRIRCEGNQIKNQKTLPKTVFEENADIHENTDVDENNKCGSTRLSVRYSYEGSFYSKKRENKRESKTDLEDGSEPKKFKVADEKNAGSENSDEDENVDVDITSYAENIIRNVRYRGIASELLQVPSCLKLDHDKIAEMKTLLMSTPDKTQTFCGCVVTVDDQDETVGPHWVYVNPELFVAMKELACEDRVDDRIPVAVHSVHKDDWIDKETFGYFLYTNSKDFSARLHEKLTYQDILRFCIATIVNESDGKAEEVKAFVKKTLKGFSKGSQNISTFFKFVSFPVDYLNKFEEFLRKYETGSLLGQNLSSRKMMNKDRNHNRRNVCQIEVPISLLKMHTKISQTLREDLLSGILDRKFEFSEYIQKLKDANAVTDMKKQVEEISKKTFEEVKKADPDMFEDQVLLQFGGAKNNAAGQNMKRAKLVKHVNAALKKDTVVSPVEQFLSSDNLNLYSLGRKFKGFDVIILNCGEESADQELCLKEQVKDNKNCAGIIIKDEAGLREDISATFSEHPDVVVVYVYTKVDKPEVIDGIKKEIAPMVVFGHKDYFAEKEVKNFHSFGLQQSLQFVLSDLVSTKEKVLYSFNGISRGVDIDGLGTLKRKGVIVSYLAKQEVLSAFERKIGMVVK